jgi:hypothetical protein
VSVAILLVPIAYLIGLLKFCYEKWQRKRQIKALEEAPLSIAEPYIKTLDNLWALHGLKRREYPDEIRLNLLCTWIDMLYGYGMSEKLNIRNWYTAILKYQEKMNRRSRLDPWATSYLFEPTIEAMIRMLSEKLPPYSHTNR